MKNLKPNKFVLPWGTYENIGPLGFIGMYIDQLEFYLRRNTQKDRDNILADLSAYQEIINSNKDENAISFIRLKREMVIGAGQNYLVIKELKKRGIWK